MADPKQVQVTVAAPLNADEPAPTLPGLVKIPYIHSFNLPMYPGLQIRIPSVLKSLELIYKARPHEIIISTPGPMGLLGLLAAKLLNVKATGIYHSDFSAQVLALTSEEDFSAVVQNYLRWFYGRLDAIKVPSLAYRERLKDWGYSEDKIAFYRKGLDTELFAPRPLGIKSFRSSLPFPDAPVLLYAGRISKDKNLDFMLGVFSALSADRPLNWVLAGDGPDHQEFRRKASKHKGIVVLGRKDRRLLPEFYSGADVFVFPSKTDTFGMAVLEAQACGLPAVVSDQGGPREIVVHRKTGLIASADQAEAWKKAILEILDLKTNQPGQYQKMKWSARQNVIEYYRWDQSLALLFAQPLSKPSEPRQEKKELAVT
jgi:glycosyltransferase involved in cell wall biosynthesis